MSSYVKRPSNAFFQFRKVFGQHLSKCGQNQANVCKEASNYWKRMKDEEKDVFREMAAFEKIIHILDHPDYKYRPHKNKKPSVSLRQEIKEVSGQSSMGDNLASKDRSRTAYEVGSPVKTTLRAKKSNEAQKTVHTQQKKSKQINPQSLQNNCLESVNLDWLGPMVRIISVIRCESGEMAGVVIDPKPNLCMMSNEMPSVTSSSEDACIKIPYEAYTAPKKYKIEPACVESSMTPSQEALLRPPQTPSPLKCYQFDADERLSPEIIKPLHSSLNPEEHMPRYGVQFDNFHNMYVKDITAYVRDTKSQSSTI